IPAFQRHAGVPRVAFEILLVRLSILQGLLGNYLGVVQGYLTEGQRAALGVAEMLGGQAAIEHLSHDVFAAALVVELVLVLAVVTAAPLLTVIVIPRPAPPSRSPIMSPGRETHHSRPHGPRRTKRRRGRDRRP